MEYEEGWQVNVVTATRSCPVHVKKTSVSTHRTRSPLGFVIRHRAALHGQDRTIRSEHETTVGCGPIGRKVTPVDIDITPSADTWDSRAYRD